MPAGEGEEEEEGERGGGGEAGGSIPPRPPLAGAAAAEASLLLAAGGRAACRRRPRSGKRKAATAERPAGVKTGALARRWPVLGGRPRLRAAGNPASPPLWPPAGVWGLRSWEAWDVAGNRGVGYVQGTYRVGTRTRLGRPGCGWPDGGAKVSLMSCRECFSGITEKVFFVWVGAIQNRKSDK